MSGILSSVTFPKPGTCFQILIVVQKPKELQNCVGVALFLFKSQQICKLLPTVAWFLLEPTNLLNSCHANAIVDCVCWCFLLNQIVSFLHLPGCGRSLQSSELRVNCVHKWVRGYPRDQKCSHWRRKLNLYPTHPRLSGSGIRVTCSDDMPGRGWVE